MPSIEPSIPSVESSDEPSVPSDEPSADTPSISDASLEVIKCSGDLESAYVEWKANAAYSDYNVYYRSEGEASYKVIDKMLIRKYSDYYRADALGLKAGKYEIKVVPVNNNADIEDKKVTLNVNVLAHERTGYAFSGGSSSGAYNDDGTLKGNADILYITNANKDKVTYTVASVEYTGIQNIMTALKKATKPLCIRFIGNITDPSVLSKGDLELKDISCGLTLEGVGIDATINGFGVKLVRVTNCEIRNLGFMNCNSEEGDNVSLNADNSYVWVHNNDIFYGDAGSDADQAKGDGALDTKTSTNVTHSYNHFWDTGKSNLQGMKSEVVNNKITYHHNWYDHSDSRHPRIRTCTVHVYNNYYDGVAKYGIGATMGASVFSENNYFNNTKNPILSSGQGTDALGEGTFSGEEGGMVKSYGDLMVGTTSDSITYQENSTSFDFYQASSRNEVVPSSIVTLSGGTSYSNFDTAVDFYNYSVDTPEVAKEKVITYAGRVSGGDFEWTFTDSENTNYAVITELKQKLVAYEGKLVSILGTDDAVNNGGSSNSGNAGGDTGSDSGNTGNGGSSSDAPVIEGDIAHNFTLDGFTSDYFEFSAETSNSKGPVSYAGLTLTNSLKMNSSGYINFTIDSPCVITLVFNTGSASKRISVNGIEYTIDSTGIVVAQVNTPGSCSIVRTSGESHLFYISIDFS